MYRGNPYGPGRETHRSTPALLATTSDLHLHPFLQFSSFTGIKQRTMNLINITSKDIARITKLLKKKEALLERVAKVDSQLSAFESGKPAAAVVVKKSKMSASARAKIAAAQKKRWAKIKGKKAAKPVARKRKMSAAGRAAIVAAQKARWAKIKAEKKQG